MQELIKLLDESLEYISHEFMDDKIYIHVCSAAETSVCPYCEESSTRVHSRTLRTLKDLAIQGKKVLLQLENRKYFCCNAKCNHKTFTDVVTLVQYVENKSFFPKSLVPRTYSW